jgi:hypothetical protein
MKVTHFTKEPKFEVRPIEVKNGLLPVKPYGGLWASPAESEYGWKEWCETEHFGNIGEQHKVTLEVDTRNFITIDKVSDLDKLPWYKIGGFLEAVDFEKLKRQGVDGIYLTNEGQWRTRLTFPRQLYGWDCESVLIMNERCIKKVQGE